MTAAIVTWASAPAAAGRLTGLRALLGKDTTEWLRPAGVDRGASVTAFMILTTANGWINATIAAQLPDGEQVVEYRSSQPTT